jgi:peptidoglycan/LPS O-acetylase OafA/YrhL
MGQPDSAKHIPALDGVRGLAILMVLLFHGGIQVIPIEPGPLGEFRRLLTYGLYGVDLFFVLSGYLITGILLDSRCAPGYFRTFYWRRSLRIFPAYYFYLAVVFLGVRTAFRLAGDDPWADVSAWPYLLYVQNWTIPQGKPHPLLSHLWSLAVEEQFYLFWPAVVYLVPRRRLPAVCVVLAAGALALRCALALRGEAVTARWLTPARLDALLIGGLLAQAVRDPRWLAWCRTWLPRLGGAAFLAILLLARVTDRFEFSDPLVCTAGLSLVAFVAAALVFGAATSRGGLLFRAFMPGWLRSLGRYSYAAYLFHPLVYQLPAPYWLRFLNQTPPLVHLLGVLAFPLFVVVGGYALGWLSWRLLERPFLRLKDRYTYAAPAPASIPDRA